jgi:hypothetical protein
MKREQNFRRYGRHIVVIAGAVSRPAQHARDLNAYHLSTGMVLPHSTRSRCQSCTPLISAPTALMVNPISNDAGFI